MERPWHKHYDAGIPAQLDYPRVPLYRLLDDAAERTPRRPATNFFGKTISYGALKDQSDRLADALRSLGVAVGDRVALLLPNSPPFVICYYGALKAGAVVTSLNPLASADELAAQIADCGAETLITVPLFAATAASLRGKTPMRRLMVARLADYLPAPLNLLMSLRESRQLSPVPSPRPLELRALLASPPGKGFSPAPVDPGSMAVLLYSGGTTGAAKGIMLSHAACVANAHQLKAWGHLQPEDRVLAVLPLFHGYGMSVNMNAALLAGGEIILLPRFNAREVLATIQRRKPTFFTGVPTMFVAFSKLPDLKRYKLDSLKGIFVGAAPLTQTIKEGFEAKSGGRMIEGYGLTEAVTAIMANPYLGQHKLGSIGVPFPDVDVKVVSLEHGGDLPPGEQGELVLRSPTLMLGYYNQPEATAEALRDGWLYTGDIGTVDEEGYFFITDRKKDLIIVGGFNVFPREVEEVLSQHPKVAEGVVVGVPDDYAGERVKAFVVLREGESATAGEIIDFVRERLAHYKAPTTVEFRSELPKTMIGKVLRRALRDASPEQERAVAK